MTCLVSVYHCHKIQNQKSWAKSWRPKPCFSPGIVIHWRTVHFDSHQVLKQPGSIWMEGQQALHRIFIVLDTTTAGSSNGPTQRTSNLRCCPGSYKEQQCSGYFWILLVHAWDILGSCGIFKWDDHKPNLHQFESSCSMRMSATVLWSLAKEGYLTEVESFVGFSVAAPKKSWSKNHQMILCHEVFMSFTWCTKWSNLSHLLTSLPRAFFQPARSHLHGDVRQEAPRPSWATDPTPRLGCLKWDVF